RIWTRAWKWIRRHQLAVATGVAAIAIATAAALMIGGGTPVDETCTGLDAPVRAAWNPILRASGEAAFAATKLVYAAPTWRVVAAALDTRADAIAAMHVEACRAARVTRDQTEAILAD